ncbi:MAG: hypothetical protein IIA59_12865 [Candidatus Marinimicrobia bacterium]|nr:hypothetical protein [Candidatus Neomarinimicrobiota bacterium]
MSESKRKLAAIMFTDLVGYSALSQKNEALALELLEEHRRLLRPLFTRHNGTEIKTIGDAFLVEFGSAVEAARCAIDIQKMLVEHNSSAAPERRILLRIGLHIGDVVMDGDDVLGDAVNIASRIEPLAEPGGICMSEDVAHQVRNKTPGGLQRLGERKLKGIVEQVTVYKIVLPWEAGARGSAPATGYPSLIAKIGPAALRDRVKDNAAIVAIAVVVVAFAFWGPWRGIDPSGEIRSIAVLPLENLMGDPDQDYFVDGMHEALTSQLTRFSRLKVISRTSAMRYKNSDKSVPEIAAELGVDAIVEGSVLKAGGMVRITAQLIDGRTDLHLWASEYDRRLEDILSLHRDVARAIANEINLTLSPEVEARLAESRIVNPEAYNYVLLGDRSAERGYTKQSFENALSMYTKAAALDSTYAQAYAGQASMHASMYWFHFDHSAERILLAREALSQAERLAPDDPIVLYAKGMYLYQCYLDYDGALKEFDNIRAVWPNNPDVTEGYATVLRRQGKMEESAMHWRRAASFDPLNTTILLNMGITYGLNRAYPEAMASLDKAISMAPDQWRTYYIAAGILYRWDGNTARSREMLAAAQAQASLKGNPWLTYISVLLEMFDGQNDQALALLRSMPIEVIDVQFFIIPKSFLAGQMYHLMGDTALAKAQFDSARAWLEESQPRSYDDARYYSALGLAWAGLGEREKALEAGRRGVAELPVTREAWRGYLRLLDLAMIQTITEDYEAAIETVDRLLTLPGDLSFKELLLDPRWAALTQQPGFSRIEQKYGGGL